MSQLLTTFLENARFAEKKFRQSVTNPSHEVRQRRAAQLLEIRPKKNLNVTEIYHNRFNFCLFPPRTSSQIRTPILRSEAGWCSRRGRRRRLMTGTGLNHRHPGWSSSRWTLLRSGPEKATALAEMVSVVLEIFSRMIAFKLSPSWNRNVPDTRSSQFFLKFNSSPYYIFLRVKYNSQKIMNISHI